MPHWSSITAGLLWKWMVKKWSSLEKRGKNCVSFVQTHAINITGYLNSILTDPRAFINILEWEQNRTRQEETNIIQQTD